MRIVAGKFGGRRLRAEVADATRPTSDRVREALGSALAARGAFEAAQVLDLFAGTGAFGLEALSRGAAHVVAVDNDKRALRCIADNVATLGVEADHSLVALDLLKAPAAAAARLSTLGKAPFTLIFADPPYAHVAELPELLSALLDAGICADDALVVLEHPTSHEVDDVVHAAARFKVVHRYRYGDTSVTLLAPVS